MSNQTYNLEVQNGQASLENGFFFKAAPFRISTSSSHIDVTFKKGSKGKVVYELSENGTSLIELDHPFYTPANVDPDQIDTALTLSTGENPTFIFAALIKLDISTHVDYKAYFKNEANIEKLSYKVTQNQFL